MNYRHGDLALIGIDKLPYGLTASKSHVIMTGSRGNDHTVSGGTFYPRQDDEFIIGYLVAELDCKLFHADHGIVVDSSALREAVVAGGIYKLLRQHEDTHDGMKAVED